MTDAREALETLIPGETPLTNLDWADQIWLGTAMNHLLQINRRRAAGGPGNNCYCVFAFDPGNMFVQFLAPFDEEHLWCEAVSASYSSAAAALTVEREDCLLNDFGFAPPGVSPNYFRRFDVRDIIDIGYAARSAFRVLKQVYLVETFELGTFKLNIPRAR